MTEQLQKNPGKTKKVKTSRMDDTKYFSKIYNLVLRLQGSCGMTAEQIAEFMGASRRTAQRTILDLEDFFKDSFIRETGKPPVYKIKSGCLFRNIIFTQDELMALQKAVNFFKEKNDDDYKILEGVREKVRNKNEAKTNLDLESLIASEGVVRTPGPYKEIKKEYVDAIRKAIKDCHPIKVTYLAKRSGKIRHYESCPYGILYGYQNHYLLVKQRFPKMEYANDKVYYLILSNIQELEILEDESFTPDPNFSIEKFTEHHFGMWHEEEPFECEWLFSPKAAPEAKYVEFHPSQKKIENPDGSLTVKFTACGIREMDWYLYTWGSEVKVIKPVDYEERLAVAPAIRY